MKHFFLLCTSICALLLNLNAAETQLKRATNVQHDLKNDLLYLVIDLSGGANAISYPVSYLSTIPEGGWAADCKMTKLVLRRIEAGTFMMGSPVEELGRWDGYEDFHEVTLTEPYYNRYL